jgi:hypothetical protein
VRLAAGSGLDVPDLIIKVFEHRHAGLAGRLRFVISSTDRRLGDLLVLDGDLGIQDLNREFADWEEDQLRAVGALAGQPGSTVADLTATLARVGCSLFEQLLPKTLQELCWTFRQRDVKTLLILSGRIGFSLTRLGSWGARQVELGCGGFVGTLWPVSEEAAFAFAQALDPAPDSPQRASVTSTNGT